MKQERDRRGFSLPEVIVVSGLMAALAMMLGSAWGGIGRPIADVIRQSQLFQEMDAAAASLARDLGGNLTNPEGRLGDKKQGRWIGCMQQTVDGQLQLWLCFDLGSPPNGQADWGPPDTVIIYHVQSGALVRYDRNAGTSTTIARYVDNMQISTPTNGQMAIQLTFTHRQVTRTCTLIAYTP
jgi:prepilin-type N-terminal cleavage/methylation domain-containing protein